MVDGVDFTHGKINLDKLIEKAFNDEQKKVILEVMKYNRATFENHSCPTSKEEISMRTRPNGKIIGLICEHYTPDYGYCKKKGGHQCTYHKLIGR